MKTLTNVSKILTISIFCCLLTVGCTKEGDEDNVIPNVAPVLSNTTLIVNENITTTVEIVKLVATDENKDDLTYAITQNSDDLFAITNNGSLTLAENAVLDFETKTVHTLTVEVSDGELTDTASITINITDIEDTISATAAIFNNTNNFNITNSKREYNFSNDRKPQIEVENYKETFTYQLKLTGVFFKQEYIVDLNLRASVVADKKDVRDIRIAKVIPVDIIIGDAVSKTNKTTLEADLSSLDMTTDEYTVKLVEVESRNELEITTYDNVQYVVIDADATDFLSTTQIESDAFQKLNILKLNTTFFRIRPANPGRIKGKAVELGVYDIDLNLLGKVNWSSANGSSNSGVHSYRFESVRVNDLIPSNGSYLFRLEEKASSTDNTTKVLAKGVFQQTNVQKISIAALKQV